MDVQSTPRARFSSNLGSMGTPARRAPGTPMSARRTLDRSVHRPSTVSFSRSNAVTDSPRNIFRASMTADRSRHAFTPRASSSLRHTFSPAPPSSSRAFRSSTAAITGPSMGKTTSSAELFNMTIDDPPSTLDGEALMDQVPTDNSRPGSVYADEFMAHTCPPGLDAAGRSQWFCILDLRRLKYAANELFAKKDWRINVMNFAKEYEKSRNLIQLHYGLYEFKTSKPTNDQIKKWRADNDIPDEETTPVRRAQANKRKADDDLPLSDSTSNKNKKKRRQVEPTVEAPLEGGKRRRVSDSPDENQPTSKMTKTATTDTPSKALSAFMKVAGSSSTPSQAVKSRPATASSSLFPPSSSTPGPAKSIFENPKAAVNAPSPNIFEHLSDASRAPSVTNGDADGESETDSAADESEDKDTSEPSVVASGVATPANAREGTPGASFFNRVTKGQDGKPLRAIEAASPELSNPVAAASFSSANRTWTADSPIKFSGSASQPFGASKSTNDDDEPKESSPFKPMFAPKKVEEPKQAPGSAPAPAPTPAPAYAPAYAPASAPAPAAAPVSTTNIFAAAATTEAATKPSETASPFATKPDSTPAPASSNPLFGPSTAAPPKPAATATTDLFASASQTNGIKADSTTPSGNSASVLGSSTLFGSQPAKAAATEAPKTVFGMPLSTAEAPKTSMFAIAPSSTDASSKPATSLFGAAPSTSTTTAEPAKRLFGSTAAEPAKPLFGAAPPSDDKPKPMFGAAPSISAAEDKPSSLFGSTPAAEPAKTPFGIVKTEEPKPVSSMFGGPSAQPASSNLFGSSTTSAAPAPASQASFGASTQAAETPASSFSFGNSAPQATPAFGGPVSKPETTQSSNLFGSSAVAQPQANSFSFGGAPATNGSSFDFSGNGAVSNPFSTGGPSAPGSFEFNFGGNGAATPAAPAAPVANSGAATPFVFGGGAPKPAPAVTQTFGGMPSTGGSTGGFSFSAGAPAGNSNNMFAPSQASLAAPGGASTGTSSPFNFGGASSLATTPAAATPEPTTAAEDAKQNAAISVPTTTAADNTITAAATGQEEGTEKHAQISLTEGGEGEEDEEVIYEVRCKAMKEELGHSADSDSQKDDAKSKSAWSTKGVGPLRILKHKTTGVVRVLVRAEPRGNVVINNVPIPSMPYSAKGKYCVAPFANEKGGLDKWMLMVKTADAAKALSGAITKAKVKK